MKYPKGTPCHAIAPLEYRRIPNITGSYELDSVISANRNKDMEVRLGMYAGKDLQFGGCRSKKAYGPNNNYNAYDGYSGDE